MLVILIITIISFEYTYLNAQDVPYDGNCTFTHDCADWREGRVICDEKKTCTCRQPYSTTQGNVFWDSTGHRCVYCPTNWFYRETRCYYFEDRTTFWSDARHRCQTVFKADLITFNSPDDLDWLRKHGTAMTLEYIFSHVGDSYYRRYWIGAMNEPFVKFGQFSWVDNNGFQFNQNSSMWCTPGVNGVPLTYKQQPTWGENGLHQTRVALARWKSLFYNQQPVLCLDDEQPGELLSPACQRTSATFQTKCNENKDVCQNDGICTAVTEKDIIACDCTETPYGGAYCTENCGNLSSYCQNGGNCTKSGDCVCNSLWSGLLCEIAIDPCLSNPCQHNTKCSQMDNTTNFICDCEDSGWTGDLCDSSEYPCPAERCHNNGQCKLNGRNNFTCNCLKTGFQGMFCEQGCLDTDKPCQNEGSCINNACTCNPLTQGDFCEIIIDKDSIEIFSRLLVLFSLLV
ncbi:unnamed protein product [Adineta steineri]|uniref:Uncharacterized protein n=1 Tax=Adineta steineri TaxID=433720 RepID=A0A815YN28_9BILA|nr:unnamed protein product [Adineta steineri]CAF1571780.1 unnamed protein product [Adineta steineri]